MAVVNTLSTQVTNMDAKPPVLVSSRLGKGRVKSDVGVLAAVSGDSIGSTYRMVRVPSSARVRGVYLRNTAITSGAADVGIYQTAQNGGAVVDADLFASAASIATATTAAATEVTAESGVITVANFDKQLWSLLGLTADPGVDYDVTLTLTAATTAAGTVALTVDYCEGN